MTGAADVPDDLVEPRGRRRRRELPGDRPARLPADHPQLAPERPLVDLDDDAVDLEVELVAAPLPPAAVLDDAVDVLVVAGVRVDLEASLAQPFELGGVGRQVEAPGGTEPVAPDGKRPARRDRRVELADRAGGRVAGVRERRLAGLRAALVEVGEGGDRQVDLAADLDQRRGVGDPQGDRADRPQVVGDVLADAPVAAGGAAGQDAVLVGQRHRQAVDLRLGRVADLLGGDVESLEQVADPLLPGPQLLLVAGVAEREHRLGVLDLGEAVKRLRADPLGRRVGREQLRVGLLELAQLVRGARRRRRRRSRDRRGRNSGGCGARSRRAAPRRAWRLPPAPRSCVGRRRRGRIQHPLQVPAAQLAEAAAVGEVEVDRRDGDAAVGDRRQVGALLVLERRLEPVDLVALAAGVAVLADQLELVVVEALAEVGDLDARRAPRPGS